MQISRNALPPSFRYQSWQRCNELFIGFENGPHGQTRALKNNAMDLKDNDAWNRSVRLSVYVRAVLCVPPLLHDITLTCTSDQHTFGGFDEGDIETTFCVRSLPLFNNFYTMCVSGFFLLFFFIPEVERTRPMIQPLISNNRKVIPITPATGTRHAGECGCVVVSDAQLESLLHDCGNHSKGGCIPPVPKRADETKLFS